MSKGNQYYRLIEYVQKKKIAKVFNFRTQKVEVYLTVLTKKEKLIQQKRQKDKLSNYKSKVTKSVSPVSHKNNKIYLMYQIFRYYLNLYTKYKRFGLLSNRIVKSLILKRFFRIYDKSRYSNFHSLDFLTFLYKNHLEKSFFAYNRYKKCSLNLISVYINIYRNNIYITVIKDKKTVRIFSPCLFRHIPKRGKKKSISFFYTVKRTIMYMTRFFFNKRKKYFLKIFFKGFQRLRRPLLSRFFFNSRLKRRCIGIYNVDSEPFNGCRLRKSKRIQFRGQKKQGKRFSF
jgi:hypothetical protein